MITRLKNRPRLDALDNQRRGAGKKLGRRVYLGCLYGIGGFFAYFFFGTFFILDSDGLVMKDQRFIETTFSAQVVKNHVQPGSLVKEGQILVSLQSQDILDSMAKVSGQRADLIAREEGVRAKMVATELLLPVAKDRARRAKEQMQRIDRLDGRGYITNGTRSAASELLYATQRDVTQLESEVTAAQGELDNLTAARETLENAIAQLTQAYNDGVIRAPVDGIVGARVPSNGEVFGGGETIMEVLSGRSYVLAYVPTSRFYSVEEGQPVVVSDGYQKAIGRIAKMGRVTDALPSEFQGAFATTERLQIMTIEFDHEVPFVLKAKVKVSGTLGINGAMAFASRMIFGTDDTVTATTTNERSDDISTLIASSEALLPLDATEDERQAMGVRLPEWVAAPAERPDVEFIEPLFR
ncbi:MAG: HlyD family efflux transporter periplasmic adaptor subunit [Pseudomonadota bacterium]